MSDSDTPRLSRLRGPHGERDRADIFARGSAALPDTWLFHDGAPSYMGDARLDAMMTICLELGAELWATRRRLGFVEKLLQDAGVVTAEQLKNVRLGEDAPEWTEKRTKFIERVLGSATAIMAEATSRSQQPPA